MAQRIGIIGLGIMGSAFARNLGEAGLEVSGCDIDDAKVAALRDTGLAPAATPEDVIAKADRLILSLPNAGAYRSVTEALAATGKPVVVADTCTLNLSDKEEARAKLAKAGQTLLDCPVGGTGTQAAKGDLVVFGSGDADAFETMRPVFERMSRVVHYLGPFGRGIAMKFIHNLLVVIHDCAAAEAFAIGHKSGLDPKVVYDVIASSAGTSRIFEVRGPMMVAGEYDKDISATLRLLIKDVDCIARHAREVECPAPLFTLAGEIHRAGMAEGYADSDPAVVCRVIEKLAGIER